MTDLLMNPYPLLTLNHFTVPVTLFAEMKKKIYDLNTTHTNI